MTTIPIVVSAYNRPEPLSRILQSLKAAQYGREDILLYISLDKGGPNGTKDIAETFDWPHGPKVVLARSQHLGMRDHAFACMDLFGDSEQLIFLEDDSFVGPEFFSYSMKIALNLQNNDELFAASLYSFDLCEFDSLRFSPVPTGEDVYLVRSATTWGIMLDRTKWTAFRAWHQENANSASGSRFIPKQVNEWPGTSWKKFLNRYISEKQLYFAYPTVSHLSHFADVGTHFSLTSSNYQVPMAWRYERANERPVRMDPANLATYDEFWEFIPSAQLVDAIGFDFEFDLRRIKSREQYRKSHVITSRSTRKAIRSFGRDFFSLESNVLHERPGSALHLTAVEDILDEDVPVSAQEIRHYMKNLGIQRELQLSIDSVLRRLRLRK